MKNILFSELLFQSNFNEDDFKKKDNIYIRI